MLDRIPHVNALETTTKVLDWRRCEISPTFDLAVLVER